jgi:hypothetical protein
MYWIPPPYCWQIQNVPTPIAEPGAHPYCRAGRTLEPSIHSLYIKNFQKSKYWGPIAGACLFQGPICSPADPLFKAENHPLNRKNWNAHGVIPTYRVTPRSPGGSRA